MSIHADIKTALIGVAAAAVFVAAAVVAVSPARSAAIGTATSAPAVDAAGTQMRSGPDIVCRGAASPVALHFATCGGDRTGNWNRRHEPDRDSRGAT